MARPSCYDPTPGYRYQIIFRMKGEREWEHLDFATDMEQRDYLLAEYRLAYRGMNCEVGICQFPREFWPKS